MHGAEGLNIASNDSQKIASAVKIAEHQKKAEQQDKAYKKLAA